MSDIYTTGQSLRGTHAERPPAGSVNNGTQYWEIDTLSMWVSDGVSVWNAAGSGGGSPATAAGGAIFGSG